MKKNCPICQKEINVSASSGNICCSRECAKIRNIRKRADARLSAESSPRTCSKCGKTKPISEFFSDNQKANGYRPDCKECNQSKSVAWSRSNRDKHYGY